MFDAAARKVIPKSRFRYFVAARQKRLILLCFNRLRVHIESDRDILQRCLGNHMKSVASIALKRNS